MGFPTKFSCCFLRLTMVAGTGLLSEVRKRCDAMIGDTTRLERLIGCLEAREPELVAAFGHAGELKLEPEESGPRTLVSGLALHTWFVLS